MGLLHEPVLGEDVVACLVRRSGAIYVDATLGLGGHAEAILLKDPGGRLLGIDRHLPSLEKARERLKPFAPRTAFHHGNFEELESPLRSLAWGPPDAILADLGISRWQLEGAGLGLSFQMDEPLDMRLNGGGPSAAEIVNHRPAHDLARIFREYGEEPMAEKIAKRIVEQRSVRPIATTADLASLVASVKGRGRKPGMHPATQVFMALRIAVNDELGSLERFLPRAIHSLALGGRIAVISFHSLEDRLVKRMFKRLSGHCTCPPDGLPCHCAPEHLVTIVTKKAVTPAFEEQARNPLSRSAKLRAVERSPK